MNFKENYKPDSLHIFNLNGIDSKDYNNSAIEASPCMYNNTIFRNGVIKAVPGTSFTDCVFDNVIVVMAEKAQTNFYKCEFKNYVGGIACVVDEGNTLSSKFHLCKFERSTRAFLAAPWRNPSEGHTFLSCSFADGAEWDYDRNRGECILLHRGSSSKNYAIYGTTRIIDCSFSWHSWSDVAAHNVDCHISIERPRTAGMYMWTETESGKYTVNVDVVTRWSSEIDKFRHREDQYVSIIKHDARLGDIVIDPDRIIK